MATATVTVMFTDLVDSTALMSRVGETAAEALRREHFAVLRAVVDEHRGREVKSLGDGLMVVFASAADAVAAAVGIQRTLERRNRRAAEPLVLRVGLALGDADMDDGDYFGVPVVQASRLCARAGGGEVLCTDVVRLLAGSRVEASYESLGELELKGLADPVAASRIVWPGNDSGAVDSRLPARLAAAVTDIFAGRAAESDRLVSAWKRASLGREAQLVLISGEPGIGKTTLTAHVAAMAHGQGARVVYGRCDEDLGIPYQPWIEGLAHLVGGAPDEVLAAHVDDRGAHLARLVPLLSRRTGVAPPASDGGDADRFVLLSCVADLLERVCTHTPVLLVLDDLHWADRQSLQVLRHVATSAMAAPLLIVGTFRDSDVAAGDPMSDLLAALHRVPTSERIALRGLDDAGVLELLERAAGHEMDDRGVALRDAVLAETDGNPFFVNEILRHLAETGSIYRDTDGRWVGDLDVRSVGLPVSVTEVVGRRVAALGAETQRLLTIAAVIGRDFDVAVLAAAADADELDVIDRCDAAVAAAVLQPTAVADRYTFTHALVERTLHDSLSPSRRSRAHRAVAEAIEAVHGTDAGRAGELAHHWVRAVQPADATKALHYVQLAGDRALERAAPHDALRWFTQAVELTDQVEVDPRRHVELLIGLGIAQRQIGQVDHRSTLLDAARRADVLGDARLYVRAALAGQRGFQSSIGNTDHERVAVLRRALDVVGPADSTERATLLLNAAAEQMYSVAVAERLGLVEQAIAIARRLGNPGLLAWVLAHGCVPVRTPDTLSSRSAWLTEAAACLPGDPDPILATTIAGESCYVALAYGDGEAIDRWFSAWRAAGHRVPESARRWTAMLIEVTACLLHGDLGAAERRAEDGLSFGMETAQPDAFTLYGAQLSHIRFWQGRSHELLPLMEGALSSAPELHAFQAAIAIAAARSGSRGRATELLEAALAAGFDVHNDESWLFTIGTWAVVAAELEHARAAEVLHGMLAPHRPLLVHALVVVQLSAAALLGQLEHVLGRWEDADRSFADGDAIHRRLGAPMLVAEGEARWAAMLADRSLPGDRERALDLAARALDVAVGGGYGDTEAVARRVIARLVS